VHSPARFSLRQGIGSIIGANGGDDVRTDIVKASPVERIVDSWAVSQLIDWTTGKGGTEKIKQTLK
jgi:hypothetical protein